MPLYDYVQCMKLHEEHNNEFLSLLNLDTVLKDSTPKKNWPAFDNIDQG